MVGLRAILLRMVAAGGWMLGASAPGSGQSTLCGAQRPLSGGEGPADGAQGFVERSADAGGVQAADGMVVVMNGMRGVDEAVSLPLESSVGGVMRDLAARAGVVFVGRVARVERKSGVVEIVFDVQQPVLGTVGPVYTLREWGGLWAAGERRFMPGQRAMVFLHTPNEAGFSSPVDGMDGVVPVIVQGADAEALLDVRWLATHVVRARGTEIVDGENGAVGLSDGVAVVRNWRETTRPEPVHLPLPVGVRGSPVRDLPVVPVVRPGATIGVR